MPNDGARFVQGVVQDVGWVERSEPHQNQPHHHRWGSLRSNHPPRIVRGHLVSKPRVPENSAVCPDAKTGSDSKPPTIFFSVGEPSGDLHGANLIRQLRERCPDIQTVGYGGPKMAEAGCQLHADLTALAVMWVARVVVNLHKFWDLGSRADRFFRHHRPDAVVLIDYPGFNWWIARRAKAHGIPVFYYSPPQIWAWARWRVKKMRRFVDHVLCGLPFEEAWLREHGCNATFVGHPFFDEVRRYPYDERFIAEHRSQEGDSPVFASAKTGTVPARKGPLVAILPGSRTQEVANNLRWFLKAAAIVHEKVPDARFALAAFKPHQAETARTLVERSGLPIEVCLGKTPEIMRAADCAMSVSGSVSLELLYHTVPTVILYWISPFAYLVQTFFRKVKYITLVNLLSTDGLAEKDITPFDPSQADADRVLFPEYLTCEDRSAQIAAHVVEWLTDPAKRTARVEALAALKEHVAHGGASGRAADYILNALSTRRRYDVGRSTLSDIHLAAAEELAETG
jgi:lipid-A-disaccharide synthase